MKTTRQSARILALLLGIMFILVGCGEAAIPESDNSSAMAESSAVKSSLPTEAEKLEADLEQFVEIVKAKHADPFCYMPEAVFDEAVEKLRADLPGMEEKDFLFRLQSILALLKDAHTQMNVVDELHIAPIAFLKYDDGWFIRRVLTGQEDLLGCEIIAVEGVPVDEACERISPYLSSENEKSKQIRFSSFGLSEEFLSLAGVLKTPGQVTITVKDSAGNEFDSTLATVPFNDWDSLRWISVLNSPAAEPEPNYRFEVLDGGILYIKYKLCYEDERYPIADFILQLKYAIHDNSCRNVIVDLRDNGGGNSGVLNPVIEMLKENVILMRGTVYTLINPGTGSAAVTNAYSLKSIGSILVGQPTFQSLNFFGNVETYELTNTGYQITVGTRWSEKESGYEGSLRPDVELPLTFTNYVAGIDPTMDYCLAEITKPKT